MDQEDFKLELILQFGTAPCEDIFRKLCKLQQTSMVSDYQSHFERLLGKAGTLTDKQEMACFISRLREPYGKMYGPRIPQPSLQLFPWP